MSIFAGKTLMITGGTGSFGNAVLNRFLQTDIAEIRIFSRDEKKQDDMRHEYQTKMPDVAHKIKFFIGDVRNLQSCKNAMPGVDYIFHAAALKQVPSCEFFPMEAVQTNVIGTDNVLTAAIEAGVKAVICLSTDKAAYPINAMGITKAIEEKIAVAKSRYSGDTKICCTRYGNVMCSRGSVIPLWIDQIRHGNPITLTEPKMTRFIMSLEEAGRSRPLRLPKWPKTVIYLFRKLLHVLSRLKPKPYANFSEVRRKTSRSSASATARKCTRPSSPTRNVPRPRTWATSIACQLIIAPSTTISSSPRAMQSVANSPSSIPTTPVV